MKRITVVFLLILVFSHFSFSQDVRDILSKEAFEMLKLPSTYLVDVRTIAEYVFIGHPEDAVNLPLLFWNEREQKMEQNPNFMAEIKARFKPGDTLIFLCRSGGRSARAYRSVQSAGFKNLYNVKHGFEGDRDDDGYRTLNGWKNSRLPFSFNLNSELVYKFKEQQKIS